MPRAKALGNKLVLHLGYFLSADLPDDEDIVAKRKDLRRKANCMLSIFSSCDHLTKNKILQLKLLSVTLWLCVMEATRSF